MLAISGLAVGLLLVVVAFVGQSWPARTAPSPAVTTTPASPAAADTATAASATGGTDAWPPTATDPECQERGSVSPDGCQPNPSAIVSGTDAAACLSLIYMAAQAMSINPDIYARVVAETATAGRTVDDVIHDQLSQARPPINSQLAATAPDPEVTSRLNAIDTAINTADGRPCGGNPPS
jgi:hypothetical protein